MDPLDPPVDPEIQPGPPEAQPANTIESISQPGPVSVDKDPWETRILLRAFMGSQGLRAGWSVLAFVLLFGIFAGCVGFVFFHFHLVSNKKGDFAPSDAFFSELISFLAMVGAGAIVALIERRRGNVLAYNLNGPRGGFHFLTGAVSGFAALSVLIGVLALGGWLHFGNVALSGVDIFKYAALWAGAFLLVAFVEEGSDPYAGNQLLVGAGRDRPYLRGVAVEGKG